MTDARDEQRMTLEQLLERVPIEILPARAPVEPLAPEPPDEPIEPPQTAQIRRSPEVLVVPSEFGIEHRGLILNRVVPMVLAPLRHRLHTTPKTLANGPDVNREPPPPAARTDVRIAEDMLDPTCPRICVLRTYVVSNVGMAPGLPGPVLSTT